MFLILRHKRYMLIFPEDMYMVSSRRRPISESGTVFMGGAYLHIRSVWPFTCHFLFCGKVLLSQGLERPLIFIFRGSFDTSRCVYKAISSCQPTLFVHCRDYAGLLRICCGCQRIHEQVTNLWLRVFVSLFVTHLSCLEIWGKQSMVWFSSRLRRVLTHSTTVKNLALEILCLAASHVIRSVLLRCTEDLTLFAKLDDGMSYSFLLLNPL